MGVIERLSDLELSDDSGQPRPLASFWQDRAVVLAFIRHFG